WRLGGGTADLGRYERSHPTPLTRVPMVRFRIVAGIRQHGLEAHGAQGGVQERYEAIDIDARAPPHQDAQQHMAAALEGGFQLGVTAIKYGFPAFIVALAAAHVIGTASAAVQASGVHSRTLHAPTPLEETADRRAEQATRHRNAEQATAGFLEGGEVRHHAQAPHGPEIEVVVEMGDEAAIVGLEEGLE